MAPARLAGVPAGRGQRAVSLALAVLSMPALILWIHFTVGWAALVAPWSELGPLDVAVLLGGTLLAYAARPLRLYVYFHGVVAGAPLAMVRLTLLHNLFNNLLPMRTGEAAFPLLMKRYFGQRYARSASSLLWIRLLDLATLVGGASAVVAVTADAFAPAMRWPAAALTLLSAAALLGTTWLAGVPPPAPGPGVVRRLLATLVHALPGGRARAFQVLACTVLAWAGKGLAFVWLVVKFTGLSAGLATIGVAAGELSSVLPIHGLAGSGTYEAATVGALVAVGVAHDVALLAAVNVHLFLLGIAILLGMAARLLPVPPPPTAPVASCDAHAGGAEPTLTGRSGSMAP